jgi:hypothetical protein
MSAFDLPFFRIEIVDTVPNIFSKPQREIFVADENNPRGATGHRHQSFSPQISDSLGSIDIDPEIVVV